MKTFRSNFTLSIFQTVAGWSGRMSGCSGKGVFTFSADGKSLEDVVDKLESVWPGNEFYDIESGTLPAGHGEESGAQSDPGYTTAGA